MRTKVFQTQAVHIETYWVICKPTQSAPFKNM